MKGNGITYRQAVCVVTLFCAALISVLTLEAVNMESEKLGKGVTIANKGISNPVLVYNGKPMMRMGSVSETGLFAFPWDSSEPVVADKTHSQWAEWQKMNDMGYARHYLSNRAQKGFTGIQVDLNPYAWTNLVVPGECESPFLDDDSNAPNENYWQRVDWMVDEAARHGLYVLLTPMWGKHYPRYVGTDTF